VARSAAGPGEQALDGPLQDSVGREADGILHTPSFQRLVQGRESKGRVGTDDHDLSPGPVPVNDGEEDLIPPVRTVDVARPERGGQAVAVLVEDEERVIADGLEVAVVGGLLLGPWTGLSELSMSRVTRRVPEASRCTSSALRRESPW
jgi:hypothetical protein